MKFLQLLAVLVILSAGCGMIEDAADIPQPGMYKAVDYHDGYESILVITKLDKGYDVVLTERTIETSDSTCVIDATGKKSSYAIWVETPNHGARLSIYIKKLDDVLELGLKGVADPKAAFTYCLGDRSPLGMYSTN